VRSGRKTSMHYFSYSGGPSVVSIKNALGQVTLNLSFCIWWDPRITYCIPVRPLHETSMHYFSCSGGPIVVSIKNAPEHITPNLCFFIRWNLRVTSCIPPHQRKKCQCTILHGHVGPVQTRQKARWDTLHRTCFFTSNGFCGSRSGFPCVRA
jgi:hypothetical protein